MPGNSRALGTIGTRAKTVSHETTAVTALAAPESRYQGYQKMPASIRCVIPHETMNAPNR